MSLSFCKWVDISLYHDRCLEFNNQICRLKSKYKTYEFSKNNSHYIGKIGECLFSHFTGLPVDWGYYTLGDKGYDFEFKDALGQIQYIDVKTTCFWKYPELKEFTGKKSYSDFYILVALDPNLLKARLVGYATQDLC
mgnify:CR=1 FL=1